jgi:alcohol dehydrogenase class IV
MPVSLTAATGLDALTQCIEAYVSQRANAVSDALALQGMALISRHLRRVVADGDDLEARCAMSLGAMLSGMALSQAGVGAAHAISMVLGGRYGVQHGIGVSLFLAGTIALNARAAPAKYLEVARALGAEVHGLSPADGGEMAIGAVHALVTDVGLDTRLDDLGVPREEYPEIARAAASHPDMGPNPARLTPRDIEDLLKRAA